MKEAPGRPSWVTRIQLQVLSPATLERYLKAGWPISAIAGDRGLSADDVKNAMERWDVTDEGHE